MAVTLEGITLPADIQWRDEFEGFGVGQTITPTLTGALVIEENGQAEGRAITLDSGGASWVGRSTVEALESLAGTPLEDGETLELVWGDGRTFAVVFDRSRGPAFAASEVLRVAADKQGADHPYTVTLNLLVRG